MKIVDSLLYLHHSKRSLLALPRKPTSFQSNGGTPIAFRILAATQFVNLGRSANDAPAILRHHPRLIVGLIW